MSDKDLRAIEAEFRNRAEYGRGRAALPQVTMPSELEFQTMAAAREEREKVEREKRAMFLADWQKERKRERRRTVVRSTLAGAAMLATVKSGGLIDRAVEPFSDAGGAVESAVPYPQAADYMPVRPGETLDGIPYEDFSEDALSEWRVESTKKLEDTLVARQVVVDLFRQIDDEGYDKVLRDAAEYRDRNAEMFIGSEQVDAARTAIESAETNTQVMTALGDFMAFYDVEVGFKGGEEFADREGVVKDIANAFVNVYAPLPKDFIALASVSELTVSKPRQGTEQEEKGSMMGTYSSSGVIDIVAQHPALLAAGKFDELLLRSDTSYEGVVAHELGHALDENLPVEVYSDDESSSEMVALKDFAEHIARTVVSRPEAPSVYAKSDQDEYSAEIKSGVLSDRSDGLATPNEWRKFGSDSNKAMIRTLVRLEEVYPGIAMLLVANRAG